MSFLRRDFQIKKFNHLKVHNQYCVRHPHVLYSNVDDWWFVDLLHVHRPFTLSCLRCILHQSPYKKGSFLTDADILSYWKHHIRADELIPFDRNKWKFGLINRPGTPKGKSKEIHGLLRPYIFIVKIFERRHGDNLDYRCITIFTLAEYVLLYFLRNLISSYRSLNKTRI